jgi:hypothetical protein
MIRCTVEPWPYCIHKLAHLLLSLRKIAPYTALEQTVKNNLKWTTGYYWVSFHRDMQEMQI